MPDFARLQPNFGSYIDDLSDSDKDFYEERPTHVKFFRKIVLAWTMPELLEAIRSSNGGATPTERTIRNIEDKKGEDGKGTGGDASKRKILAGIVRGLKDRGLTAISYADLYPN